MLLEAVEPSPHGDGGDARNLRGGTEGNSALPAVDKDPEGLEWELRSLEPGYGGYTERFPAPGTTISSFGAMNMAGSTSGAEDPGSEGCTGNDRAKLGIFWDAF